MSKKILKRSLALGALMAFVITGSAWAADSMIAGPLKLNDSYKNESVITGAGENLRIQDGTAIHVYVGKTPTSEEIDYWTTNYGGVVSGTYKISGYNDLEIVSDCNNAVVGHSNNADGEISLEANNIKLVNNMGNTIIASNKMDIKAKGNLTLLGAQRLVRVVKNVNTNAGKDIYADVALTATNVYMNANEAGEAIKQLADDAAVKVTDSSKLDIQATNNLFLNAASTSDYSSRAIYVKDNASVSMSAAKAVIYGGITTEGNGTTKLSFKDLDWTVTANSKVTELKGEKANIKLQMIGDNFATVEIGNNEITNLTVRQDGVTADDVKDQQAHLDALAYAVDGADNLLIEEGEIVGAVTAAVTADGKAGKAVETVNTANQAIGEAAVNFKAHYRAHMNDMNKRMGELRMANGETGVWTRMVRGENEFEGAKSQYNQYQLGYDEKLSVDKRWTVGAAVTFAEGTGSFSQGSTEDDSTAFAIYGSKLNNDGTFVDLIARYARLESDITMGKEKADYSTNGYSVSAEFGKRIQQGKGFWIEPQVELTYGSVDSAEYIINGKDVTVGDMDSLIGRVGFSLGKDIKQGNVYARASYLYDFDGETDTTFGKNGVTRTIEEDLGGGWWEVGVGANINLSKATYIYADIEKTFGGEVDTNWQWNLGVRYSF